jgi:hypothetical protein
MAMRKVITACTLAAITTLLTLFSNGVASAAQDVTGQPYSKAVATLRATGETPVVSTVVGGTLPQAECIVVNEQTRDAVTFGKQTTSAKVLLSLNCNPAKHSSTSG